MNFGFMKNLIREQKLYFHFEAEFSTLRTASLSSHVFGSFKIREVIEWFSMRRPLLCYLLLFFCGCSY